VPEEQYSVVARLVTGKGVQSLATIGQDMGVSKLGLVARGGASKLV